MRLAFAGTPEFAATALRALVAAGHELALVLTQPDRPAGRGMRLQGSAVKLCAQQLGLSVLQPRGLRLDGRYADDAALTRQALQAARPEALVVAAYGLILPAWTLGLPPLGCLNIHASLLPRWRGAAPVQRAIEAGDSHTGVTIMQMDAGLDTGAMLMARSVDVGPHDTSESLLGILAPLGGQLMVDTLGSLAAGRLIPVAQDAAFATYAAKIDKAESLIDWRWPAQQLERRLRAFDPAPGMHTLVQGVATKVWRARWVALDAAAPGQVLPAPPGQCRVACGSGALELLQVQRAGGRRQAVAEWLMGVALPLGSVLGADG